MRRQSPLLMPGRPGFPGRVAIGWRSESPTQLTTIAASGKSARTRAANPSIDAPSVASTV